MFLLDSLMIAGIKWAIETTITAAEAEMNDDTALREQLLAAEMSREMGEISDEEFEEIEADLLSRIREIKQRREGGTGPLAFGGAQPMETSDDSRFQIEASVSGDFYDPADAPHTTVIEQEPTHSALAHLVQSDSGDSIEVMDLVPGDAGGEVMPALPLERRKPVRRASKAPARKNASRAKKTASRSRLRR